MLVDEGGDVGLKLGDATMGTAAYFLVGEQGEEPLDLDSWLDEGLAIVLGTRENGLQKPCHLRITDSGPAEHLSVAQWELLAETH